IALTLKQHLTRQEKMEVWVTRADVGDIRSRHELLLRSCEGVLLCRKAAPDQWLRQFALDVLHAEQLLVRPPFLSRAFLLPDASNWDRIPDLRVIPYTPQFQPKDLEPFLAPLRRGRAEHAGG